MAAAEFPDSYKDPLYASLDGAVSAKLGLPDGLLSSIRTLGERSNHSQTSEAGAKTVYQIVPSTRVAAVKKYGIDPYLSPENAAEVAGLLLRDSLQRQGGDVSAAVAEYHGGTNQENWGPRTKNYVQRVLQGVPQVKVDDPTTGMPSPTAAAQPQAESTFDRLLAKMGKPTESQMAAVYQAYQSGQMTPESAKQFEEDVQAGKVMLPRGGALKAAAPGQPAQGKMLPQGVIDAYLSGQMPNADKAQVDADVKAGLWQLPQNIGMQAGGGLVLRIPGTPQMPQPSGPQQTIGDKIIGAGEAALNTATGMTGGTVGMVGGTVKGLAQAILSGKFGTPEAANMVEQAASEGAQALTYAPRTESGQDQAAAVGHAMQNLVPIAAVAPALAAPGALARDAAAARAATPANVLAKAGIEGTARDVANAAARPAEMAGAVAPGAAGDAAAAGAAAATRATVQAAQTGAAKVAGLAKTATTLPRRALERLGVAEQADTPTPGTMGSVGAAGTDMATMRQATASDLPVPIQLTKGQATRDAAQLKFEAETAKIPDAGAPLRQRAVEQNQALESNFDHWVDQTGAQAPNLRATGQAVDSALVAKAARDKTEIRARYKAAEKAGELDAPVLLSDVVQHLNESAPDAAVAPLLTTARARALQTGIAQEGPGGQLVPAPVSLKTAETFRQAIGAATDYTPTNVRQATILKGLIDQATDGMGGNLYKQARAARARYAQQYEDRAVISKLLNNKRGTADRQVAFEDVFKHSILDGSLDDVRTVRKVLQTGGAEGQQAWRELQGATLRDIRDQMTKNVATDSAGNRVISPAALDKSIKALDATGKLDFIFGKKGAQQLRDIRDLAQYVKTVPPEAAVNFSNTASTLMAGFGDIAGYGMSGAPVPVFTMGRMALKYVKDSRLRNRIQDALNENAAKQAPNNKPKTPQQAPGRGGAPVH